MIQTLENAAWFTSVGFKDVDDFVFVESWLHAAASFSGSHWEAVHLEGMNLIRDRVQAVSRDRYNQWNDHVDKIKPSLIEICKRKCAEVMQANGLPEQFWWSVCADLIGVGMESEYSDVIEPGFFTNVILDCYLKGHFPCGWEGEFPAGRLIVY